MTVYEAAVNAKSLTPLGAGAKLFLGPGASRREIREWWRGLNAIRARLDTEAMVFCVDRAGSGKWECTSVNGDLMRSLVVLLAHRGAIANGRSAALIYKSTAAKRYGLTPYQIEQAVESGLLRSAVRVKNPYHSTGPPALLVEEAELAEKLEAVRALPRRSEAELERAREYARGSKMLAGAAFHCPVCNRMVRPLPGEMTRDGFPVRWLTPEEARAVAVVTHFRRAHTAYDDVRRDRELVMRHYLTPEEEAHMENIEEQLGRHYYTHPGVLSEMMAIDEMFWRLASERMKRAYTEEAIAREGGGTAAAGLHDRALRGHGPAPQALGVAAVPPQESLPEALLQRLPPSRHHYLVLREQSPHGVVERQAPPPQPRLIPHLI